MHQMKLAKSVLKYVSGLWREREALPQLSYRDCSILSLPGHGFDSGFCLGDYSYDDFERTSLGKLIYRFKYKRSQEAGNILADLASELIKEKFTRVDILINVPPSFTPRVFQPLDFLAEKVSSKTGLKWQKDILARTRLSKPQKELTSKSEKRQNVSGLFKLKNAGVIKGKSVLLLDDIYDSGATLSEICSVLKQGGAYNIVVVTLTRTRFDQYGLP